MSSAFHRCALVFALVAVAFPAVYACPWEGSVWYKVTTYREKDRYDRMAADSLRSSGFGFLVRRHKKVGSTVSDIPDGYKWEGESTRSEACSNCGGSGQVWISN
ncbi:MAG: hypothetical protein IJ498_05725 [Akkermansia sp.]|nr:hypothetical protein [Akkermansia sp.]